MQKTDEFKGTLPPDREPRLEEINPSHNAATEGVAGGFFLDAAPLVERNAATVRRAVPIRWAPAHAWAVTIRRALC